MRNPQLLQQFQNLQKNQSNPQEVLNQITSKYTPEQKEQFRKFVNNFGMSDEQFNQLIK